MIMRPVIPASFTPILIRYPLEDLLKRRLTVTAIILTPQKRVPGLNPGIHPTLLFTHLVITHC
jgi:hypothetical protein